MDFDPILTVAGIILLICFGSILLCALLGALGFREAGVLAGSCAAGWQSAIGNVAKGTLFALSQSLAATAFLFKVGLVAIVVAAVVTIALCFYYDIDFNTFYEKAENIAHSIWSELTEVFDKIWSELKALFDETKHYAPKIINETRINSSRYNSIVDYFKERKDTVTS